MERRPDVSGVLFDLLMAVMNSVDVWSAAAGDPQRGLEWRDAVTAQMRASRQYATYEALLADAAGAMQLPSTAVATLLERWAGMEPWPDAGAVRSLALPYAFVTNCSAHLSRLAAGASGLRPRFVLSAEEAGWYKPDPRIYRQACARLGSPPASTRFVAGSAYDAEGARRAGLQAVLVRRRPDQLVSGDAIRVVRSVHEALGDMATGVGEW